MVLDLYIERQYQYDYLCHVIERLVESRKISRKEFKILFEHFNSQKPSRNQHSEFLKPKFDDYSLFIDGNAWWLNVGAYRNPAQLERIKFLKKMIKISKQNERQKT